MDLGLKNCRAFVAGASRGLGFACAKALAEEGARVFICSRNTEELKPAAAQLVPPAIPPPMCREQQRSRASWPRPSQYWAVSIA